MDEKKNIERYFNYIDKHLKSINIISIKEFGEAYKKVLYVSVIDILSQTVFPKKSSKNRVVALLKKFAEWDNGSYISLPHLFRLLKMNPEPLFENLRLFVKDSLNSWGDSELISLSRDLLFEDIKKYWPKNMEYKFPSENISIEGLTHYELFYTYRNSLVHELRPLSWYDSANDEEPFYMHVTRLGEEGEPLEYYWSLNYPTKFFEKILSKIIENVKVYLLKNELDPYDLINLGHYWLDSLNKK